MQGVKSLRPTHPKPPSHLCSSQPLCELGLFSGLRLSHSVWQITSVPVAPKMVVSFFSATKARSKCPSPLNAQLKDCSCQASMIRVRSSSHLCAFASVCAVIPSSLCSTHVPWPTSDSCPWQPFFTTTSTSGVTGSILCPHSHIWEWRAIVNIYNSWCVLCPFTSVCFRSLLHCTFLEYRNHAPSRSPGIL